MAACFSVGEIAEATVGVLVKGVDFAGAPVCGVSTDTRMLRQGEAFFALSGERHDAHDHLEEAAAKGAALLVVSNTEKMPKGYGGSVLVVPEPLHAYQELAAYYRRRLKPFVVCVTGSIGKTTLKDMIACVFKASGHSVCATAGNFNNQIGLPKTILSADAETEIFVLEMGMEREGELRRLAEIARPDVAAITNIGVSHRENFDSDEGILQAKYEIAAFLGAGDALVIDADGSAALSALAARGSREAGFDLISIRNENSKMTDYSISDFRVDAMVGGAFFAIENTHTQEAAQFFVPLPASYAGSSAALAAAVCARAGVSLSGAAEALKQLTRTPHRLEIIKKNGISIIDDTYNASPESMKSGLELLKSMPAKRRVAVLADMNELGGASEALHLESGAVCAGSGVERLYTYGEKARAIAAGAMEAAGAAGAELAIFSFGAAEKEALTTRLKEELRIGDAVYIKGSHAMGMEELADALAEGV